MRKRQYQQFEDIDSKFSNVESEGDEKGRGHEKSGIAIENNL